jgi:hypothetical protein
MIDDVEMPTTSPMQGSDSSNTNGQIAAINTTVGMLQVTAQQLTTDVGTLQATVVRQGAQHTADVGTLQATVVQQGAQAVQLTTDVGTLQATVVRQGAQHTADVGTLQATVVQQGAQLTALIGLVRQLLGQQHAQPTVTVGAAQAADSNSGTEPAVEDREPPAKRQCNTTDSQSWSLKRWEAMPQFWFLPALYMSVLLWAWSAILRLVVCQKKSDWE